METTSSFRTCNKTEANDDATQNEPPIRIFTLPNKITIQVQCAGRFAYAYRDAITAIATALLAMVTTTLWKATQALVEAGDRQHALSNRAFVHLEGFDREVTLLSDNTDKIDVPELLKNVDSNMHVTRFAVQPRWRNSGNTPTKNLIVRIGSSIPLPGTPSAYPFNQGERRMFLAPKMTEGSEFLELPGSNAVINNGMGQLALPEVRIYVWGRADYEDIFGDKHFTQWCYYVRFERHIRNNRLTANLIQWGDYNGSDHDNLSQ